MKSLTHKKAMVFLNLDTTLQYVNHVHMQLNF